jgi:hypothetical protein
VSLRQPVTDEELLADLRQVAELLTTYVVSIPKYRELGHYDATTVSRRFGSWNNAILAAGLSTSNEINIPDECLFENLLLLWQHYGRQPRRSELARPPPRFLRHRITGVLVDGLRPSWRSSTTPMLQI